MPGKLGIINMALSKGGQRPATSLTEDHPPLTAALVAWDPVVEEALRAHPWSHALVWASLAHEAESPPWGFAHAYSLPADCLLLVDVRGTDDPFAPAAAHSLSGRSVLTDVSPCLARYVARRPDPFAWPPDFADAVACRLGAEIATRCAQNGRLAATLLQLYENALIRARLNDAAESGHMGRRALPLDPPHDGTAIVDAR